MIPIQDIQEVFEMETEKLYAILEIIKATEKIDKQDQQMINLIENGVTVRIPLLYIMNKWFTPYPSTKKVGIKGYGKIPIQLFYNDKRQRDTLMRELIIKKYDNGEPTEAR